MVQDHFIHSLSHTCPSMAEVVTVSFELWPFGIWIFDLENVFVCLGVLGRDAKSYEGREKDRFSLL